MVAGRRMNPNKGGLLPKCITELKTATLVFPVADLVASKLADL
jgi:hypothetical protein